MYRRSLQRSLWQFGIFSWLLLIISQSFAENINHDVTREFTVATSNSFPPVNLLDSSGQLTGFGRDISSAVAHELGIKLKYKHSSKWVQVLDWLKKDKADFIQDTGYTIERDRFLDYTQPILEMKEVIFVKHDQYDIHSLDSLTGKKVACVNKHITHIFLQTLPYIKCHTVQTPAEGLVSLINGDVDAFIYPQQIVQYLAQKLKFSKKLKLVGAPLRTLTWSMTVREGDTEMLNLLNRGISIIKQKGIYEDIYNKWFGKKLFAGYSKTEVFYIVLFVAIITALSALLIGSTLYLRKTKQANLILAESENKYRTLVDNLPESVFLKDKNSTYISCNKNYADMLGISPEDIKGKTDYDFHADQVEAYRSGDREVVSSGKPQNFIETYIEDGQEYFIHTVKTPIFDKSGKVSAVLGIFWDITETKRLQDNLAAALHEYNAMTDTVSDIIYKLDMEGNLIWWNKQFENITGFKQSEHPKLHYSKIMASYNHADTQLAIQKTFTDGVAEVEIDLLTLEGKVPYLCNGAVFKNEAGKIIGLVGVGHDLRNQKQQELEQKMLLKQLQQAQKMETIGHLTGGIAHDFNNLLAIILGNSELAIDYCEDTENEHLIENLKEIYAAGDRGKMLISQMLAFSRSKKVVDETLQLESCILEDIKMINSTLPSTIEIKTDIEAGLPAIQMNRTQFNQIIMNLAINARDAMNNRGKLTIKLAWVRNLDTKCFVCLEPVKGDWLDLSVTDSGSGIDPKVAKKIFDPFYTTKDVGKGSGMGLSVIYGIMRDHGGYILLDTTQGKGTSFHMLFPVAMERPVSKLVL